MEEGIPKKNKVEQLDHFPFNNFQDFNKAVFEGVAHLGVDRGVALQWSQGGKYAPTSLRLMNTFFSFLPFLAALGFIVFAIATRTWLLLIALPVLIIAFFIFHPSSAMIFGPIRSLFILMSFGGLGYGIYKGIQWFLVLCLTLLIIWFAQKNVYKKAVNYLVRAVCEHEDLLCVLWQARAINIQFYNGDTYWVDWKVEQGEHIHYKEQ